MRALGAGTVVLVALGASARAQQANGESWRLFQGLHAHARLAFTVPSGPCQLAAERLAEKIGLRGGFTSALTPAEAGPDDVRVLAGAPGEAALEPLARALGVTLLEDGFRLLERDWRRPGDALVAVFEDPARPGRPLCLVLGNDLAELAAYLDELPRLSRPELTVYADGELALRCPLALDGTPSAEGLLDFQERRAQHFAGAPGLTLEGLTVYARGAPEPERWKAYAMSLLRTARRVQQWLGASEPPQAEVFLYEHLEDFRRCLGTEELVVTNRLRTRVHVLLAPWLPDDGGAGLARVLARALAGEPAAPWLADGLALAAAERWWARPLGEWQAHLARGKLLPKLEDLLAPDASWRWSEHVLMPARALLFQGAAFGAGGDARKLRALWKGAGLESKKLAPLYLRGVQELLRSPARAPAADARVRAARLQALPFRHGLALLPGAREPYSSRAVDAALAEALALAPGPNAISLSVQASLEDPAPPLCARAGRAAFGNASDLALASANAAARAQDLRVLLALEVLATPSGAWADVISWTDPDDTRRFFERYEQVALHYALLAELLRSELFCLGGNLRESLRTDPREMKDPERIAARLAGWKALLARLRLAYTGGLTYAARLPGEAGEVALYEQLDFVGLHFYPRLAREGVPDEAELRRSLRFDLGQALDLAVRWNKPLLLVQTGFPARADSWARAQVPRGALDLEAQRRFYAALAEVLAGPLENKAALRGYYLWNWPVSGGGPADDGFALRGKPAADELPKLFAR